MNERVKVNSAEVYLSRWREDSDTYRAMRAALNRVAEALGGGDALVFAWHRLRFEDVRGVPAKLQGLPSSINQALSALRGVLETAKDMKLLPEIEFFRIKVKNVGGRADKAGRALEPEEKAAIIAKSVEMSLHDAALVAVLLGAGARRVEVVKIKRDHYDAAIGRITLYGKGNKPRKVPVGTNFRPALEALQKTLGTNELMFPFPGYEDDSRRGVSYVVERLCGQLGFRKFTPHDLRRTFATYICETADIAVAQRLLGHADIKTTLLYDRRGEKAEDDAVKDW